MKQMSAKTRTLLNRLLNVSQAVERVQVDSSEALGSDRSFYRYINAKKVEMLAIAQMCNKAGYRFNACMDIGGSFKEISEEYIEIYFESRGLVENFFINAFGAMGWDIDFELFDLDDCAKLLRQEDAHETIAKDMEYGDVFYNMVTVMSQYSMCDCEFITLTIPKDMQRRMDELPQEQQKTLRKQLESVLAILTCFYEDGFDYIYDNNNHIIGCAFMLFSSEESVDNDISGFELDLTSILRAILFMDALENAAKHL